MARLLFFCLLLISGFGAHAGQPQINVGALFDYLPPDRGNLLKRVRNTGDVTAFVRVEVVQMHFDAQGKVTETPVDTVALARNQADAQGVIASPSRLIVAANGQQATRLVYRGPRTQEQYYRLRFVPVAPSAEEFALDETQAREAEEISSTIQMFTGFGTILFIAPLDARYDTQIQGRQIHNAGNATVVLDNLRQCEATKPDQCSAGIIVHIRPGQQYTLAEAPGQFSRYELNEGSARRRIDSRR